MIIFLINVLPLFNKQKTLALIYIYKCVDEKNHRNREAPSGKHLKNHCTQVKKIVKRYYVSTNGEV